MLRERCKMLFGLLCRESISLDSPRNWAHFAKVEFSQSVYCQFPALTSQTHVRSRSAAREENKKVLHIAPMDTKKWDWNTPSERGRKEIRLLEAKYKIRTEEERFLPTAQQQQPALKSIGPRREWSHRNSLRPILSRGRERERGRERDQSAHTLLLCFFSSSSSHCNGLRAESCRRNCIIIFKSRGKNLDGGGSSRLLALYAEDWLTASTKSVVVIRQQMCVWALTSFFTRAFIKRARKQMEPLARKWKEEKIHTAPGP